MGKRTVAVWIGLSLFNAFIWGVIATKLFKLWVGIVVGIIVAGISFMAFIFCGAASMADREMKSMKQSELPK